MTNEERLTAIEIFLTQKLGYDANPAPTPIPTPTPTGLLVTPTEITKGGVYKIKSGEYVLTDPINVPSNTTIDATGATFRFDSKGKWQAVWSIIGQKNIVINGGSYLVGDTDHIAYIHSSNTVAVNSATLLPDSGFGFQVQGKSENVTLNNFKATTFLNYCLFAGEESKNISLSNWLVDGGSTKESTIRVVGNVEGFTVTNSIIRANKNMKGAKKHVALRLHEGKNYLLKDLEVYGGLGFGPMAGGDGGYQWGLTAFIGKDGKWYVPKEQADMTKTLEMRRKALAERTTNVRVYNLKHEGFLSANPNLFDCVIEGGSSKVIYDTTQQWPVNWVWQNVTTSYPPEDKRLANDPIRNKPDVTVKNFAYTAPIVEQNDEDVIKHVNCTLNGQPYTK